MVTPEVRPKTTPGKAPRGNLTYVAILAFVVAAVLVLMVIVRPMLHSQAPPAGAARSVGQGAAPPPSPTGANASS